MITHEPEVAERARRVIRLADGRDRRATQRARADAGGREARRMMRRRDAARSRSTGMLRNRLRSGLTMLGMTIGVASVIVLIAVGNGSSKAVQAQIEALGSNVLLVEPGFSFGGSAVERRRAPVSLTIADATRSQNKSRRPTSQSGRAGRSTRARRWSTTGTSYSPSQFVGTTPSYVDRPRLHDRRPAASSAQPTSPTHDRVVVLGPTVVTEPVRRRRPDRRHDPDQRRRTSR